MEMADMGEYSRPDPADAAETSFSNLLIDVETETVVGGGADGSVHRSRATRSEPAMSPKGMTSPHRARKRFGQNFLVDETIIGQIIAAIGARADHHLIEIGPGTAALT